MSIPSITNCPNCGAPIDTSRSSCEYCGTPYEKSNDIHIEVNIAPMIFPEVEPTVEYIKYNTKLERLTDAVWFWFIVMIITIGCSLLPFIIF